MDEGKESPTDDVDHPYEPSSKKLDRQEKIRDEAKRFSQEIDELAELRRKLPRREYVSDKYRWSIDELLSSDFTIRNGPVSGIGSHRLAIETLSQYDIFKTKEAGIVTKNYVSIGLHTDMKTLPQVLEMNKGNNPKVNHASTLYFFDKDGKYYKISYLPYGIEDTREDLLKASNAKLPESGKFVQSDLNVGEFEIVGMALRTLRTELISLTSDNPPVDK